MKYFPLSLIFLFIYPAIFSKVKDKTIVLSGKEAEEYTKYFLGGQHFICPGENEVWSRCPPLCTPTCHKPSPNCTMHLNKEFHSKCPPAQCICKPGYIRNCDYECILTTKCNNATHSQFCNKNNIILSEVKTFEKGNCHPHEIFKECSSYCEPSCDNRNPKCDNKCNKPRCECRSDFYRNHLNVCVPFHNCPHNVTYQSKASYFPGYMKTKDMKEIEINNNETSGSCRENEVWSECSSLCEPTCQNTKKLCPSTCGPPKCQCATGFVRHFGRCISNAMCSNISFETIYSEPSEERYESTYISGKMAEICRENEEFAQCSNNCEPTCLEKNKICNKSCGPPKCQCKNGYFRNGYRCVEEIRCNTTLEITENYSSIKQCKQNEEYVICSSLCESTCGKPTKLCSLQCGEPKCQCKKGYSKYNNICIETNKCPNENIMEFEMENSALGVGLVKEKYRNSNNICNIPIALKKCLKIPVDYKCPINEEFKCCGTFEEETCINKLLNKKMTNSCGPSKCICKKGFYRSSFGKCIPEKKCKEDFDQSIKEYYKIFPKKNLNN
ncbi:Trypsin Inhibitor-like, cysteine rich domain-containing protein [Strongyloides ratti]|uniref:Trypsin Inhibitor-like, cysteine rich domain-containing protein n=1 Tax=Strongyloides ratti TaxID=34506 RepID=A0A090MYM4_STRRB|nr:Trypsin Inhibitor-like, cysteine rich domain-containing protein [Strongyloides ratti]CEF67439.1 Trypsin Inhibitor-like, cysteine rich domain-containing protein [Strongyloides ratti]